MTDPAYTPVVKRLADEVRKLTTGELVALRDTLREDFDILPPDIGDREPRRPSPEGDEGGARAPRPGVFDLRRKLGRAPTAREYRDADE